MIILFAGCLIYCCDIYKKRQRSLPLGRVAGATLLMFTVSSAFGIALAYALRFLIGIVF